MLTRMQVAFCNEYLRGAGIVESARIAGYKNPNVEGSRQLKKPEVLKYIEDVQAKVNKKNILSIEEIQENLTKIAIGEQMEQRIAKDGNIISYPSTLKTRLEAYKLLGQSKGMYVDRVEQTGDLNLKIDIIEEY